MPRHKRHHEEEHENHERWLITYADMITLLLALFMMLYAMSVLDLQKFQAFRQAFNNGDRSGVQAQGLPEDHNPPEGDPKAESPGLTATAASAPAPAAGAEGAAPVVQQADAAALQERLEAAISEAGLDGKVSVSLDDRGVVVFVTDGVLFGSGSATLLPDGNRLLDGLVPVLAGIGNELVVEGHTDDRPISSAQFPSNWELSTSRATTVLRGLIGHPSITSHRLSASGYADTRPRVPNDTPEHRATNRRVEVVAVVPSPPPAPAPVPAAAPADDHGTPADDHGTPADDHSTKADDHGKKADDHGKKASSDH